MRSCVLEGVKPAHPEHGNPIKGAFIMPNNQSQNQSQQGQRKPQQGSNQADKSQSQKGSSSSFSQDKE